LGGKVLGRIWLCFSTRVLFHPFFFFFLFFVPPPPSPFLLREIPSPAPKPPNRWRASPLLHLRSFSPYEQGASFRLFLGQWGLTLPFLMFSPPRGSCSFGTASWITQPRLIRVYPLTWVPGDLPWDLGNFYSTSPFLTRRVSPRFHFFFRSPRSFVTLTVVLSFSFGPGFSIGSDRYVPLGPICVSCPPLYAPMCRSVLPAPPFAKRHRPFPPNPPPLPDPQNRSNLFATMSV